MGESTVCSKPFGGQNTTDLLFRDLWLRPALAPRDRSLVTASSLIASGQVAQITYHLNRAMDNGLTQSQASEVADARCFLRWLAQCVFCSSRRQGSL
jgi:4-carboxymuconolactone decarboxylase